jgi:predicted GNAT family acetyltransferase
MAVTVDDNPGRLRYELHEDGNLAAFVQYELDEQVVELIHTETLDGFTGRGLASQLIQGALDDVRKHDRQVRPYCSFVQRFITEHDGYRDLVPAADLERFEL